jgi:hypothetical protein
MALSKIRLASGVLALTLWGPSAFAFQMNWTDRNSQIISLYRLQRYEEALPLAIEALDLAESTYGQAHPYTATSLNNLAALHSSLGRYEEAESLYRRALAIDEALFGETDPRVQVDRHNLKQLNQARPILPATGGEAKTEPTQPGESRNGWAWDYWDSAGLTPPREASPGRREPWGDEWERESSPRKGFLGLNGEGSIRSGYRRDRLDWSIAGDIGGQDPNILSELTWRDLESYSVQANGRLLRRGVIAFVGDVDYGWFFSGDNQDSDYLLNNRQGEFSRSNNVSDDGFVLDASAGIGYPWEPAPSSRYDLTIMPQAGYSYHRQHLTMTDGFQTIPASGSFGGLNSRYVTTWQGPWAGLDFDFRPYEKFRAHLGVQYHWASYLANARWNLRDDFSQPKSYRHTADGQGLVVMGGVEYSLSDRWAIHLYGKFQDWSTDPGIDRTFFSSGATSDTRLNQVNWESWSVSLGGQYRF